MNVLMVMDAIESINPAKDSSLALMLEAKQRGYAIECCQIKDLVIEDGHACGLTRSIDVFDDAHTWFKYLSQAIAKPLADFQVIWMRKDPPFDINYFYSTLILEHAQSMGSLVVNAPSALRDLNEKMAIQWFPDLSPPSLVSSQYRLLSAFIEQHKKVVLKPLDVMAGAGIYLIEKQGLNNKVILESMTENFSLPIMAQQFIPAVKKGDRRVMIIDGEPFGYGLKRIPKSGEFRANLAQGGTGQPYKLDNKDLELSKKVGGGLKQKGVLFAGIDIIGDYLTEINVTSPTCIREIDAAFDVNISEVLWQAIEARL